MLDLYWSQTEWKGALVLRPNKWTHFNRRRHAACHRRPPTLLIFGCKHLCLRQCVAPCNAKDFVRVFVDFIGFWDPVGVHLGIIFKKKCDFVQNVFRASKKHRPPAKYSNLFEAFSYKIVILSCVCFWMFFRNACLRSSWSFYAQAPRKWSKKEVKKDTLNQETPDWAIFDFWHTLQWIYLIFGIPEGSGGTLFPIVFPNSLWSMLPMLLFKIL